MTIVHNWKLWCETESAYVNEWAETEPTTCPHDPSGHTIDTTKTVVQETAGTEPTDSHGNPIFCLHGPKEDDERPIFVNSPIPLGFMPYYVGAGDDESAGRGMGTPLEFEFSGAEQQAVEVQYNEPVWLHDGECAYKPVDNWSMKDKFSFGIVMPASVVTPNGTMTGNCHVVNAAGDPWLSGGQPDAGQGYYIIVPAAGDGTYDVDLDQAVPVPAGMDNNGYWDADERTGVVTVSADPGAAKFYLMTVELVGWFMRNIGMGSPRGVFEVEAYRSEWISERWKFRMVVDRVSTTAAEAQAYLFVFRESTS